MRAARGNRVLEERLVFCRYLQVGIEAEIRNFVAESSAAVIFVCIGERLYAPRRLCLLSRGVTALIGPEFLACDRLMLKVRAADTTAPVAESLNRVCPLVGRVGVPLERKERKLHRVLQRKLAFTVRKRPLFAVLFQLVFKQQILDLDFLAAYKVVTHLEDFFYRLRKLEFDDTESQLSSSG